MFNLLEGGLFFVHFIFFFYNCTSIMSLDYKKIKNVYIFHNSKCIGIVIRERAKEIDRVREKREI